MSFISNQNIIIPSFEFLVEIERVKMASSLESSLSFVLKKVCLEIKRLSDAHFNFSLNSCYSVKQGYCIDNQKNLTHAFGEAKITSSSQDSRLDIRQLLINPEQVKAYQFDPMLEVLESSWRGRNTTWTALLNFLSPSTENLLDAISKYSINVEKLLFLAAKRTRLFLLKDLTKLNNYLLEAQKFQLWHLDKDSEQDQIAFCPDDYMNEDQPYLSSYYKVAENFISPIHKKKVMIEFTKLHGSFAMEQSDPSIDSSKQVWQASAGGSPASHPTYTQALSVAHLVYKLEAKSPFIKLKPFAFLDGLSDWVRPFCSFIDRFEAEVIVGLSRCEGPKQIQEVVDAGNMSFIGGRFSGKKKKPADSDDEDDDEAWNQAATANTSNEQVLVSPMYGVSCSKDSAGTPQIVISKFLNMLFKNLSIKTYGETILEAFSVHGREYATSFEEIDFRYCLETIQLATSFTLISQSLYFEDWRNKLLKELPEFKGPSVDIFSSQARLHQNTDDIVYLPDRLELKNVLVRKTDNSKGFDLVNCSINDFLGDLTSSHSSIIASPVWTLTCSNVFLEVYNKPPVSESSESETLRCNLEDMMQDIEAQAREEEKSLRHNEEPPVNSCIRKSIFEERKYHRTVIVLSKLTEVLDSEEAYTQDLKKFEDKVKANQLEPLKSHHRFVCTACGEIKIYSLFFDPTEASKKDYFNCLSFLNIFKLGGKHHLELSHYGLTEVAVISGYKRLTSFVEQVLSHSEDSQPDHVLNSATAITMAGTADILHFVTKLLFPDTTILQALETSGSGKKDLPRFAGSTIQRKADKQPDELRSKSQIIPSGDQNQPRPNQQLTSSFDDDFEIVETSLFETRKTFKSQKFKRIYTFDQLKIKLFPGTDFVVIEHPPEKTHQMETLFSKYNENSQMYSINQNVLASFASNETRKGLHLVQPVSFFRNERSSSYLELACEGFLKEAFRSFDMHETQLAKFDTRSFSLQTDRGAMLKLDSGGSLTFEKRQGEAQVELDLGSSKVSTCLLEGQAAVLLEVLAATAAAQVQQDSFSFLAGRLLAKIFLEYLFGQFSNPRNQASKLTNVNPFTIEHKSAQSSGPELRIKVPPMEIECDSVDVSLESHYNEQLLAKIKAANPELSTQVSLKDFHPLALTAFNGLLKLQSVSTTKARSLWSGIKSYISPKTPEDSLEYK